MKNLLLALCLAGLGVACRSSSAAMNDSSHACTGKDCTECTKEQMENCKECPANKGECKEGEQVCPVTGKSTN